MKDIINKRNIFTQIIKAACDELEYEADFFSSNWITKISHHETTNFIHGYSFGNNPYAAAKICNDKSATTDILNSFGVPNIQHVLFHLHTNYNDEQGNWQKMIDFFYKHNQKVVAKRNTGTGGYGVFLAKTLFELELAVNELFSRNLTLCLSPFVDIKNEFRAVVLNGEMRLLYRKIIPQIVGNGKSNLLELLNETFEQISPSIMKYLGEKKMSLTEILPEGEVLKLNWQHNLGLGAGVEVLNERHSLYGKMESLALKAAQILGMKFLSVDIVETFQNDYQIIEINSGVMMVSFSLMSDENYSIAYEIYRDAIKTMMEIS